MAHDSNALMNGVYDKLAADTSAGSFYDDLGGRIYRTLAPDDATLPLAVITLVSDVPERRLNDVAEIDAIVDVTIHGAKGSSEAAVMAIQNKLLAFDSDTITISGFNGGHWEVESRTADMQIDNKRVSITASFRVRANE